MNITRQQQILSLIKRIVSIELLELDHEVFHAAVVTDVLLSNDGRICEIWVDAPEKLIHQLNGEHHRHIQRAFTKKFIRKVVPKLIFKQDDGVVSHMDSLLSSLE